MPTLLPQCLQISAKAYGAARDTNMTLDEVSGIIARNLNCKMDISARCSPRKHCTLVEHDLTLVAGSNS